MGPDPPPLMETYGLDGADDLGVAEEDDHQGQEEPEEVDEGDVAFLRSDTH